MADFKIAYNKTSVFEGGYANVKQDNGGETYKGISRKFFPKWSGWKIIDKFKSNKDFPRCLNNNIDLEKLVQSFYMINFWNKIRGDDIKSQKIANNIYDFAVNSGVKRSIKYIQLILNIRPDGIFGKITLDLLNTYDEDSFIDLYKKARLRFINKIVLNNPSQKKFLAGWTKRVHNA